MNGSFHPSPQGNHAVDQEFWDSLGKLLPYDFLLVDSQKTCIFSRIKVVKVSLPEFTEGQIIEAILHKDCQKDPCELEEFVMGKSSSYQGELNLDSQWTFRVEGHGVNLPKMEDYRLLIISDQSDSRRADLILKENERQMRAFLDASPDVFLTIDESGTIKSYHGKFDSSPLLGRKIIGKPLKEILHLDDFSELEKLLRHSHEGALVQSLRTRWLAAEDQLVHLEIRVVPGSGKDTVLLLRDRTELFLKEENIQILEQSASMVEIVAGVGKELSNQLHTLKSYCDILVSMENAQDKLHYLRRIDEATQQSNSLLENLFSYSQGGGDQPQAYHVSDLLDQAIAFCRFGLPEGIELRRIGSDESLELHLSERQAVGMFINLIMNAREAIEGEGKIHLSCSREELTLSDRETVKGNWNPGSFIRVDVTDTGCGIPMNIQEKIFDPLYSSKSKQGGTGMGLSILRGFMQQLQGGIALESTPGQGSSFRLYFPEQLEQIAPMVSANDEEGDAAISTLNPQIAIDMLEGNLELYHTICQDFQVDYNQATQRVEEFVHQGAWEQARIIIHSIKGLAGLIGAMELQEESRLFEIILKDKSLEEYPEMAKRYGRLLNRVLQDIQTYLEADSVHETQGGDSLELWTDFEIEEEHRPLMEQLAVHLELAEYNQCLEKIAELKSRQNHPDSQDALDKLSDQIRQFNFEGPAKQIERLLSRG